MNNREVEEKKKTVAKAALTYLEEGIIIGVGTGSTVNYFIEYLAPLKSRIQGAVASSNATEARLKAAGIPVLSLNNVSELHLYIDSADAYNPYCQLVKGSSGAFTQEKILAAASKEFICIVEALKAVNVFGKYPVPVEVIPMARSFVAREIIKLGGTPIYRSSETTDNGNVIIDIHDCVISEPIKLERMLNNIPGVVSNGLFAEKPASMVLVGCSGEIEILKSSF